MNECPRCHSTVAMGDQFCGKCGLSLQDVGTVTQTADTTAMEANNPTQISTTAPTIPQSATELPLYPPPPPPPSATPVLNQEQSSTDLPNPYGGYMPPPPSSFTPFSPQEPKRRRKPIMIGVAIVLALVVLVTVGVFAATAIYHTYASPAVPTDTPVPTATQQTAPTQAPTETPTTAPTQPSYSGSTAVPTPTQTRKQTPTTTYTPTPTPTTGITPTPSPAVTTTPTSGGY